MVDERLINPLEPLGRCLDGSGAAQMRESQARPGPVHRRLDQSRADRIAQHLAENREDMRVVLNRKTLEAALPHMPMTAVVPMIAADMTGHPPLHEGAQRRGRGRLHHEMNMIRHQTEAQERDGMRGVRRGEQVEEGDVVALLVEDRRAAVPAIQDITGLPATCPRGIRGMGRTRYATREPKRTNK